MKTKTLTSAQLVELQHSLQRINDILGLSISITDAHQFDAQRPSARASVSRLRLQPIHRVTPATFHYRWFATKAYLLTSFYQYLIRAKWIASDTRPEDFETLFSGKPSYVRIKWTGSQLQLAYLIKVLINQNIISPPVGVGKWTCVYSHFVDKNNRLFYRLNSLHTPLKSKPIVEQMAQMLTP